MSNFTISQCFFFLFRIKRCVCYLRWRQLFKAKRSPPFCSHFSITEIQKTNCYFCRENLALKLPRILTKCLYSSPCRPEGATFSLTWLQCECRQWTQVWNSTGGKWCSSESATKSTADLWSESDSSRIYPFQTALLRRGEKNVHQCFVQTQDFFFCTLVLWKKARHYDLFYRENRDDRVTYTAYDTEL